MVNPLELVQKEKEWHDRRFADYSRAREEKVGRFYHVAGKSHTCYRSTIFKLPQGRALEYGCGPGGQAFELARCGWRVDAIDISSVVIAQAKEEARHRGLRIEFAEMDAHRLTFPPDSFDLVCGSGILHHLLLEQSIAEILRVLKPGGRAVFSEPLGHNFLINWFRRRTPGLRTDDEHPLLRKDFTFMRRLAGPLEMRFFCLASLGAAFLWKRPGFSIALRTGEFIDSIILKVPGFRYQAWQVVVSFQKQTPKASPADR